MRRLSILMALFAGMATAQSEVSWDSKGNELLQGTYNFRHVMWIIGDDVGNLKRRVSMNGTIDFDGAGKYSLRATVNDTDAASEQPFTKTGTYTMAASGFGFLSNPSSEGATLYAMVANGVLQASSTDDAINDWFLAAKSGGAENFTGRYRVAEINFQSNTVAQVRSALFDVNPDGQGNLRTTGATGFVGGGRRITQAVVTPQYSITNGVGTMTFGGAPSNLTILVGSRTFFVSADGGMIFGGTPQGSMLVGIRALEEKAAPDLFNGQFYQSGVDVYTDELPGSATTHSYYGAVTAKDGMQLNHQRLLDGFLDYAYDYMYSDVYELSADGAFEDFLGFQNIVGNGGKMKIGFGGQGAPGVTFAVKAPKFEGPGVFVNPAGVVNAASFAPFTAGIARGELISIAGTELAAGPAEDAALPLSLAGVEVLINGRKAPIRSVSPTEVVAQVPFGVTEGIARLKVVSGGTESNEVTAFVGDSAPGVFTIPAAGFGYADAAHADGQKVAKTNPARAGETISVFMTGLGDVKPAVGEGTLTPESPLSNAVGEVAAYLDGDEVDITFAGLAPGLVGIYRMDIKIPADVAAGDLYLDVAAPGAYSSQVQIPVGGKAAAADRAAVKRTVQRRGPRGRPSEQAFPRQQ